MVASELRTAVALTALAVAQQGCPQIVAPPVAGAPTKADADPADQRLVRCVIGRPTDKAESAPLRRVSAAVDVYDGKKVRIVGHAFTQFELTAVCGEGGDCKAADVWLEFSTRADLLAVGRCDGQSAIVEGVVRAHNHGHRGGHVGAVDVTYFESPAPP